MSIKNVLYPVERLFILFIILKWIKKVALLLLILLIVLKSIKGRIIIFTFVLLFEKGLNQIIKKNALLLFIIWEG